MNTYHISFRLVLEDGTHIEQMAVIQAENGIPKDLHINIQKVMFDVSDEPETRIFEIILHDKTGLVAEPQIEPSPRRRDAVYATRQKIQGNLVDEQRF